MWYYNMPTSNDIPGYSKDEIVAEITSFYKFLVRLYIPAEKINYPPPGGWPQLTPQSLAFLGKTDIAMDLIRHLPYISLSDRKEVYEIWPQAIPINYLTSSYFGNRDGSQAAADRSVPGAWDTIVSPHIVTFARANSGRDGEWAFLDTLRGTITVCDFQLGGVISARSYTHD